MTSVATTTATPAASPLAGDLSPSAPVGADPEAALAMLEVTVGSQAEQADRSDRESAELVEEKDNDEAVATMHDKASLMFKQAWVDFGVTALEACAQASSEAAGGSTGGSAGAGGQDQAALQAFQSLCDGVLKAGEANDDADVKGDESGATAAGFTVTGDTETLGDASTLVKAAISAYQQYVTTEAQTQAAALHRA